MDNSFLPLKRKVLPDIYVVVCSCSSWLELSWAEPFGIPKKKFYVGIKGTQFQKIVLTFLLPVFICVQSSIRCWYRIFKYQYRSRPFEIEIHQQNISLFTPFIQIKEILSSHMHMCILISGVHEYHNPYYFYSVSF